MLVFKTSYTRAKNKSYFNTVFSTVYLKGYFLLTQMSLYK